MARLERMFRPLLGKNYSIGALRRIGEVMRIQTYEEAARQQDIARRELAALPREEYQQYEAIAKDQYLLCWHLMVPEGKAACTLLAYMDHAKPADPPVIDGAEAGRPDEKTTGLSA